MRSFEEKSFDNATDFLAALRISDRQWWPYHEMSDKADKEWVRNWYFRGQRDAAAPLVPSAMRSPRSGQVNYLEIALRDSDKKLAAFNIQETLRAKLNLHPDEDNEKFRRAMNVVGQALGEIILVNEFTKLADSLGHNIPDVLDAGKMRPSFIETYVEGMKIENKGANDRIWTHPTVALAQHHGIPTRLLDWTRNPLKAAFFAALRAANEENPEGKIAVFAINTANFRDHIKRVEIAYNNNRYLQAQEGLFIYDSKGDEFYLETGRYLSLEESIDRIGGVLIEPLKSKKLTLPASEAVELLRLLYLEGITQAHLMPTLDNVAETLKTKWRLYSKTALS